MTTTRKPATLAALEMVRQGSSMYAAARKHGLAYTTVYRAFHQAEQVKSTRRELLDAAQWVLDAGFVPTSHGQRDALDSLSLAVGRMKQ